MGNCRLQMALLVPDDRLLRLLVLKISLIYQNKTSFIRGFQLIEPNWLQGARLRFLPKLQRMFSSSASIMVPFSFLSQSLHSSMQSWKVPSRSGAFSASWTSLTTSSKGRYFLFSSSYRIKSSGSFGAQHNIPSSQLTLHLGTKEIVRKLRRLGKVLESAQESSLYHTCFKCSGRH